MGNSVGLEVGAGVLGLGILPECTDLNLGGKDSLPRCVTDRKAEERKIKIKKIIEINFVCSKIYKFVIVQEYLSARKPALGYSKTGRAGRAPNTSHACHSLEFL